MRPVNLLPHEHRAHVAGGKPGSAYVLVGILALLLAAAALYVVTSNQVNSRKEQALQAKQEADRTEAEVARLGGFGNFAQIAATRKAAVSVLAGGRFDWERFMRELSRVLPSDVWLTAADATVAPGAGGSSDEDSEPGGKLEGCAKRQSDVARLMVRLRDLHRVHDVTLQESTRGESDSSGSGGCGRYYSFKVTAVFEVTQPEAPSGERRNVPASLGGGQ